MFKGLMEKLSGDFHLIAPDYPGFGFSGFPDTDSFKYTFGNIAVCIDSFLRSIDVNEFFIYLHDYGSAIGLRICMKHPDRILGIIVQNGNAYMEGLGPQWDETRDYWRNPTPEKVKAYLSEEGTKTQYTAGLPNHFLPQLGPKVWLLDWALLSRPGNIDMQFDLNRDYSSNLQLFGSFQQYFRTHQPAALILWVKYDAFFSLEEAYCYQRDLPNSNLHILDGGHMLLLTNFEETSALVHKFCSATSGTRRKLNY
ncbi:alpha/beta hydrolase [Dyadobacter sp. CY107]|nr:alpha/beta hydrolase [Dyadobacter fanqingshengii]